MVVQFEIFTLELKSFSIVLLGPFGRSGIVRFLEFLGFFLDHAQQDLGALKDLQVSLLGVHDGMPFVRTSP